MEHKEKDFLYRVLSIDLCRYLRDLGFEQKAESKDVFSFTGSFYPKKIIVDKVENGWYHEKEGAEIKTIIDLGTILFKCDIPTFMGIIQSCNYIPETQYLDQHQYLPFLPKIVKVMPEVTGLPLNSLFYALGLPADFVNRHCTALKVTIGSSSEQFDAVKLKTQQDTNHILVTREMPVENIASRTFHSADESHRAAYHLVDQNSSSIDVFTCIADLLVKQYQYEKLHIPVPSQLLLSNPFAFEKAREVMEKHVHINLYLPNTPANDLHKGYAQWLSPKYRDFSPSYRNQVTLADAQIIANQQLQNRKKRGLGL